MLLQLKSALLLDLDELVDMNKQLIEDEGSANPMNTEQLTERMRTWMQSDWHIDLLMNNEEIVGYALYRFKENQYRPEFKEAYLRQYYIKREHRKQGYGLAGIELLRSSRFKEISTIEIDDVLESNRIGKSFWARAGFVPYACNMQLKNHDPRRDRG